VELKYPKVDWIRVRIRSATSKEETPEAIVDSYQQWSEWLTAVQEVCTVVVVLESSCFFGLQLLCSQVTSTRVCICLSCAQLYLVRGEGGTVRLHTRLIGCAFLVRWFQPVPCGRGEDNLTWNAVLFACSKVFAFRALVDCNSWL
jgi:hypothetical protein